MCSLFFTHPKCFFTQVVSVKVHASSLPSGEERTLRASGDLLMVRAAPVQPGSFPGHAPLPLGYAKCLPPFSFFSSVLTVNVHTLKTAGINNTVQVVDCVGEHALLTLPSRFLYNLLGVLNRVSMDAALFHTLATPSTASRDVCWVDDCRCPRSNCLDGPVFQQSLLVDRPYIHPHFRSPRGAFLPRLAGVGGPGGSIFFYEKVAVDAPEEVVNLVADNESGCPASVADCKGSTLT